jgi:hypothetical protein
VHRATDRLRDGGVLDVVIDGEQVSVAVLRPGALE